MAAILSFEFQIKLYIRVHEYVGMDMEEGRENPNLALFSSTSSQPCLFL